MTSLAPQLPPLPAPGQPISQEHIDAMRARQEWARQQVGGASAPAAAPTGSDADIMAALTAILGPPQGAPAVRPNFNGPAFNQSPVPFPTASQPQGSPGRQGQPVSQNVPGVDATFDRSGGMYEGGVPPPPPPPTTPWWLPGSNVRVDHAGQMSIVPRDFVGGDPMRAVNAGGRDILSAGFDDEVSGMLGGDTEQVRAEKERLQAEQGGWYTGGQVLGGLAGSGLAAAAAPMLGIPAAASLPGAMAASTGAGMLGGAAYGAGSGTTPEERLRGAGSGALTGAAFGAAGPLVGAGLGKVVGRMLPNGSRAAPTTQDLKLGAQRAYHAFDNSGLVIDGDAFNQAMTAVSRQLRGLDPTLTPYTIAVLQRLQNATRGGIDTAELQNLREIASDAAWKGDGKDSLLAGQLEDAINDFLRAPPPGSVLAGNAADAVQAWRTGDLLWRQLKRAEELDEIIRRANVGPPAQQGARLRQEFTALAKNQNKFMRFSPDERAIIQAVADGTPIQNLTHSLGRMAPDNPLAALFALGSLGTSAVVGFPVRAASNAISRATADRASDFVHRGGPSPIPYSAGAAQVGQGLLQGGAGQGLAVPYAIHQNRLPFGLAP